MTESGVFLAGFFLGASPGFLLLVHSIFRAHSLRRAVERVAFSEGKLKDPIFSIGSSTSETREFQANPTSLLQESDSETLRLAKQALLDGMKVLRRRATTGGAALFAGAILGAGLGYLLAQRLGTG